MVLCCSCFVLRRHLAPRTLLNSEILHFKSGSCMAHLANKGNVVLDVTSRLHIRNRRKQGVRSVAPLLPLSSHVRACVCVYSGLCASVNLRHIKRTGASIPVLYVHICLNPYVFPTRVCSACIPFRFAFHICVHACYSRRMSIPHMFGFYNAFVFRTRLLEVFPTRFLEVNM